MSSAAGQSPAASLAQPHDARKRPEILRGFVHNGRRLLSMRKIPRSATPIYSATKNTTAINHKGRANGLSTSLRHGLHRYKSSVAANWTSRIDRCCLLLGGSMNGELSFSDLMNLTLQNLRNKLRAEYLKRRIENSKNDIELSNKRIANAQEVIKSEQKIIDDWQQEQPKMLSELRDLGAI